MPSPIAFTTAAPEPPARCELPRVAEARQRDVEARARLRMGHVDSEPEEADFATCIRVAELRRHRGRRRR